MYGFVFWFLSGLVVISIGRKAHSLWEEDAQSFIHLPGLFWSQLLLSYGSHEAKFCIIWLIKGTYFSKCVLCSKSFSPLNSVLCCNGINFQDKYWKESQINTPSVLSDLGSRALSHGCRALLDLLFWKHRKLLISVKGGLLSSAVCHYSRLLAQTPLPFYCPEWLA